MFSSQEKQQAQSCPCLFYAKNNVGFLTTVPGKLSHEKPQPLPKGANMYTKVQMQAKHHHNMENIFH